MPIRRLTAADAAVFKALRLKALRDHPFAYGSTPELDEARPLKEFAERFAASPCWGAFEDGKLAAFAGTYREASPKQAHKAYVWGVCTHPDFLRRGLQRAVMLALIADARGSGLSFLNLGVGAENLPARTLYESLGFTAYGTEPAALRVEGRDIDETLMTLRL